MSRYSQEIIDRVRAANDILEVISGYLNLRRKGQNYFGLCPFHHEKTPSFSVNEEMQIFHCFGCGAGGNVFTFIMRIEGLTFTEAVRYLARRAGIALPEDQEDLQGVRIKEALYFANRMAAEYYAQMLRSPQAEEARAYLAGRGITEAEYDLFGLGYAPNEWDGLLRRAAEKSIDAELLAKAGLAIKKESGGFYDRFRGRITFAIKDLTGQVVAFGARRLQEDGSPKYINSPETEIYQKRYILYGLYDSREAIRKADQVIIVEGYTDWMSLYRVGIRNIVATSGTALTEDHAAVLRRYTSNAVLFFDSDSAGAAASLRGADILLENGLEVKICSAPEGKDPDEFARRAGAEEVKRVTAAAVPLIDFKLKRFEALGKGASANRRAELTRELLGSVAKMSDPIRRSFLVRDFAERLHVDEAFLWSELTKLQQQNRAAARAEKQEPEPAVRSRRQAAEIALLEVSLRHPEVISPIMKNLNLEDIADEEIRRLFERFKEEPVDPDQFRPQDYVTAVGDAYLAERLSGLLHADDPFPKFREYARQCLINLHLELIDEKIRQIKELMKEETAEQKTELLDQLRYHLQEREKMRRGEHLIWPEIQESL